MWLKWQPSPAAHYSKLKCEIDLLLLARWMRVVLPHGEEGPRFEGLIVQFVLSVSLSTDCILYTAGILLVD